MESFSEFPDKDFPSREIYLLTLINSKVPHYGNTYNGKIVRLRYYMAVLEREKYVEHHHLLQQENLKIYLPWRALADSMKSAVERYKELQAQGLIK